MTLDKVSKNAFVEPFSAPQNYVANYLKELTQKPNQVLHFCGAWVYRQSESAVSAADFLYVDIQQKTKLDITNKVAVFNENGFEPLNRTKIPLTKKAVGTII